MNKKVITIDCDNVLAATTQAFCQYYASKFGDTVDFKTIEEPYPHECPQFFKFAGGDLKEKYYDFYKYAHEHKYIQPLDGAKKSIDGLLEKGYELHVITGRMDELEKITRLRLEEHFNGLFTEVHFTNDKLDHAKPKGLVCKEIGSILHIDDFYHYAESIAAEKIPTLLFDYPRNRSGKDNMYIKRVSGWGEIFYCKNLP